MRRNEARLLSHLLEAFTADRPERPLLVCGVLNDHVSSAPVRAIRVAGGLIDLRPVDPLGAAWTSFDPDDDVYRRVDYLLANDVLAARLAPGKCAVLSPSLPPEAGAHRPLYAVFE
jgi:hypothetical protein